MANGIILFSCGLIGSAYVNNLLESQIGSFSSLLQVITYRIPQTILSKIKPSLSFWNSHVCAFLFKSVTYWPMVSSSC